MQQRTIYYYMGKLDLGTCEQKPPSNVQADVSSMAKGLNFDLSLHLHQNFVYESCKGSGESVYSHLLG